MTADLLRAPSPPRFVKAEYPRSVFLLRVGDVNYIAGLSVEVMALQGDAEGFSTKRSNNGRFRATMWPPAASNHPSTAYAATVEICDRRHLT